jgi:GntR family transcriptional regulator
MQTGLHRNTISKVYRQLEEAGVVDAQAGSGIYVRDQTQDSNAKSTSPLLEQNPKAYKIVQTSLDELLRQGCSLNQARELFLAEIDWRLRCSAQVLVTVPAHDLGNGEVLMRELKHALNIPVQLVPLEELGKILDQTRSGTVVTSRYFIAQAEEIAGPKSVRVIPVDIYDFDEEIKIIKQLPKGTCLGIVSLSSGTLGVAEVIIHSLRGDDLLVMTAQLGDNYKMGAIVRSAQTIMSDQASCAAVKAAIAAAREDLIRPPQLICCENFIVTKSINLLKRELGLE